MSSTARQGPVIVSTIWRNSGMTPRYISKKSSVCFRPNDIIFIAVILNLLQSSKIIFPAFFSLIACGLIINRALSSNLALDLNVILSLSFEKKKSKF